MKQFEVTMSAVSKKTFTVQANTQDEALSMVDTIFENTDLLDFDADMDSVEISCTEQCGGVCEVCSNYCELCGNCGSQKPVCVEPDKKCEHRCMACGACMAEHEDE